MLVDDGSTDGSGSICDFYAAQDERIVVCHKQNGGVSSARNYGISRVQTPYLVFADSDDYVNPEWLEHLLGGASSDLVVAGYVCHENGKISESIPNEVHTVPDLICELFEDSSLGVSCRYCFKTVIIKENCLRFNDAYQVLEDECFVSAYLSHTKTIKVLPFADYQYVKENNPLKYEGKWNDDVYFDISRFIFSIFEQYNAENKGNSHRTNDVKSYYLIAMYKSFVRAYRSKKYAKAFSYYQQLCTYAKYWRLYPKLVLFNSVTAPMTRFILKSRL